MPAMLRHMVECSRTVLQGIPQRAEGRSNAHRPQRQRRRRVTRCVPSLLRAQPAACPACCVPSLLWPDPACWLRLLAARPAAARCGPKQRAAALLRLVRSCPTCSSPVPACCVPTVPGCGSCPACCSPAHCSLVAAAPPGLLLPQPACCSPTRPVAARPSCCSRSARPCSLHGSALFGSQAHSAVLVSSSRGGRPVFESHAQVPDAEGHTKDFQEHAAL